MKKIEIEIPEGKELKLINGVYTLVDAQNITERIKTFEDACRELGNSHRLVREWLLCGAGLSSDLDAYLRLRIITEALNEGWKPQFMSGERRWYFWFKQTTKEHYDRLSTKDKYSALYPSNVNVFSNGDVFCGYTVEDASCSDTIIGSRLVFKSKELAEYAGKQFTDLYIKFCF